MAKEAIARSKGRPSLEQAVEIDAAIRDAAMAVLVEQGESATVQAVAQAAGISRKTLYARYPNREQLFSAVMRDLLRQIRPLRFERQTSAAANVRSYIAAMMTAMLRPDALAAQRLLAADASRDMDLKAELVQASRTMFTDPLVGLIAAGAATGEFAVEDAEWTASAIMRLVVSEVFASEALEGSHHPASQDVQVARIADLVLGGIVPRPA